MTGKVRRERELGGVYSSLAVVGEVLLVLQY